MKMKFPTNKEIKRYKVKQKDIDQFRQICDNWAKENPTQAEKIIKEKKIPLLFLMDEVKIKGEKGYEFEALDTPFSRFSYWIFDKYRGRREADIIIAKLLSGDFLEGEESAKSL